MSNQLIEITSSATFDSNDKPKAVVLFGASWHEACAPLEAVLSALTATAPDIFFGKVDAESVTDLTDKYNVEAVPTILFVNGGNITERLEGGVDPSQLTVAVQRLMSATAISNNKDGAAVMMTAETKTTAIDPEKVLNQRLSELVKSDTVMLFMKGNATAPRCGFSRQAVELLQEEQIPFGSFDILSDESIRQGLKKYSDWPTYPQIYVNGELIGGLDILKETAEEGPLKEQWNITSSSESANSPSSLDERLEKLVKRNDVMIFMKGLPSAPRCGFSRQLIEILDSTNVAYDAFNILDDDEVRQGLKKYSNWPTYPQVYVKGELVGGLDIIQELQESDELIDTLNQ